MEVRHHHFSDLRRDEMDRADPGIQLVFAGGTCLSKAHRLIDRMSEDLDIKVVLTPLEKPLRKGRGDRSRLIALHDALAELFKALNLPISSCDARQNPRIRDNRRYCALSAGYSPAYPQLPSLRPELQLEIIQRTPLLPTEKRTFGYLYESLAGLPPTVQVSIQCISIAETAAEKCYRCCDAPRTKGTDASSTP